MFSTNSPKFNKVTSSTSGADASGKLKLRRCGPYTVPWSVRRRWLRHIKQHALFFQWVAAIAARHANSSYLIHKWGVPLMVSDASESGFGSFVSGPSHITPLSQIEEDDGDEIVKLLTNLPGVKVEDVLGTRQLFAQTAADPSNLPWMPSLLWPAHPPLPTVSRWWTPSLCTTMTAAMASDRATYPKGYGPQRMSGTSMKVAIFESTASLERRIIYPAGSDGNHKNQDVKQIASIPIELEQQIAAVENYSAVLPSRPFRQELENFPQEYSLCETAVEVISAWEGGGVKESIDGFRNSISSSPLRWRPKAIIDVGGGNGTMPWLAGHRMGTAHVINIERFVTPNNIGFDGGRRSDKDDDDAESNRNEELREVTQCGGLPIEIPHTGCLLRQLGYFPKSSLHNVGNMIVSDTKDSDSAGCDCCPTESDSPVRWCEYGPNRWSPRVLPYYRVVHKDIREVNWRSDVRFHDRDCIVMTKHLCGAGVDHLLRQMELQQFYPKYLFINSCCHMKSSFAEYINRRYLEESMCISSQEVYQCVSSRTSWLHQWDTADPKEVQLAEGLKWQERVGKCIEGLMDLGRVKWLRERGYSACIVEHVPSTVTPRNKLLIARRHDGLLV